MSRPDLPAIMFETKLAILLVAYAGTLTLADPQNCAPATNGGNTVVCPTGNNVNTEFYLGCINNGGSYFGAQAQDGNYYYIDFNKLPSGEFGASGYTCQLSDTEKGDAAGAQADNAGNCYSTGALSSAQMSYDSDASVLTVNLESKAGRSSLITITCDETAKTPSYTADGEDPNNQGTYDMSIKTRFVCPKYACGAPAPAGSGAGGGTIVVILFFVCVIVYFGGGFVFLKFVKKTDGTPVPQAEFWSSLPGLIKDGFRFTKAKLTGQTANYESV